MDPFIHPSIHWSTPFTYILVFIFSIISLPKGTIGDAKHWWVGKSDPKTEFTPKSCLTGGEEVFKILYRLQIWSHQSNPALELKFLMENLQQFLDFRFYTPFPLGIETSHLSWRNLDFRFYPLPELKLLENLEIVFGELRICFWTNILS